MFISCVNCICILFVNTLLVFMLVSMGLRMPRVVASHLDDLLTSSSIVEREMQMSKTVDGVFDSSIHAINEGLLGLQPISTNENSTLNFENVATLPFALTRTPMTISQTTTALESSNLNNKIRTLETQIKNPLSFSDNIATSSSVPSMPLPVTTQFATTSRKVNLNRTSNSVTRRSPRVLTPFENISSKSLSRLSLDNSGTYIHSLGARSGPSPSITIEVTPSNDTLITVYFSDIPQDFAILINLPNNNQNNQSAIYISMTPTTSLSYSGTVTFLSSKYNTTVGFNIPASPNNAVITVDVPQGDDLPELNLRKTKIRLVHLGVEAENSPRSVNPFSTISYAGQTANTRNTNPTPVTTNVPTTSLTTKSTASTTTSPLVVPTTAPFIESQSTAAGKGVSVPFFSTISPSSKQHTTTELTEPASVTMFEPTVPPTNTNFIGTKSTVVNQVPLLDTASYTMTPSSVLQTTMLSRKTSVTTFAPTVTTRVTKHAIANISTTAAQVPSLFTSVPVLGTESVTMTSFEPKTTPELPIRNAKTTKKSEITATTLRSLLTTNYKTPKSDKPSKMSTVNMDNIVTSPATRSVLTGFSSRATRTTFTEGDDTISLPPTSVTEEVLMTCKECNISSVPVSYETTLQSVPENRSEVPTTNISTKVYEVPSTTTFNMEESTVNRGTQLLNSTEMTSTPTELVSTQKSSRNYFENITAFSFVMVTSSFQETLNTSTKTTILSDPPSSRPPILLTTHTTSSADSTSDAASVATTDSEESMVTDSGVASTATNLNSSETSTSFLTTPKLTASSTSPMFDDTSMATGYIQSSTTENVKNISLPTVIATLVTISKHLTSTQTLPTTEMNTHTATTVISTSSLTTFTPTTTTTLASSSSSLRNVFPVTTTATTYTTSATTNTTSVTTDTTSATTDTTSVSTSAPSATTDTTSVTSDTTSATTDTTSATTDTTSATTDTTSATTDTTSATTDTPSATTDTTSATTDTTFVTRTLPPNVRTTSTTKLSSLSTSIHEKLSTPSSFTSTKVSISDTDSTKWMLSTFTSDATTAEQHYVHPIYWIRTVIQGSTDEVPVTNHTYKLHLQDVLQIIYEEAFFVQQQQFLGLEHRRKRSSLSSAISLINVTALEEKPKVDLIEIVYYVRYNGSLILAKNAVKAVELLDDQIVALHFGHVVEIKAEPYLKDSTPELYVHQDETSYILLLLILGSLAALLLIILLAIVIYRYLCCKQYPSSHCISLGHRNRQRTFEEEGTSSISVIGHGGGDAKLEDPNVWSSSRRSLPIVFQQNENNPPPVPSRIKIRRPLPRPPGHVDYTNVATLHPSTSKEHLIKDVVPSPKHTRRRPKRTLVEVYKMDSIDDYDDVHSKRGVSGIFDYLQAPQSTVSRVSPNLSSEDPIEARKSITPPRPLPRTTVTPVTAVDAPKTYPNIHHKPMATQTDNAETDSNTNHVDSDLMQAELQMQTMRQKMQEILDDAFSLLRSKSPRFRRTRLRPHSNSFSGYKAPEKSYTQHDDNKQPNSLPTQDFWVATEKENESSDRIREKRPGTWAARSTARQVLPNRDEAPAGLHDFKISFKEPTTPLYSPSLSQKLQEHLKVVDTGKHTEKRPLDRFSLMPPVNGFTNEVDIVSHLRPSPDLETQFLIKTIKDELQKFRNSMSAENSLV